MMMYNTTEAKKNDKKKGDNKEKSEEKKEEKVKRPYNSPEDLRQRTGRALRSAALRGRRAGTRIAGLFDRLCPL